MGLEGGVIQYVERTNDKYHYSVIVLTEEEIGSSIGPFCCLLSSFWSNQRHNCRNMKNSCRETMMSNKAAFRR
ncbi:hypothetical protein Q1695_013772 [Nippostrongylus brasiliensis]|nr:hypothetical protein Q1695_013772 [Nippostrongylus brasiliensis]